jgi:integral membrane protein (TIGR01906 family)
MKRGWGVKIADAPPACQASAWNYDTTSSRRVELKVMRGGGMRIVRRIAALLFILSIPVALITTNIRFIANEPRVYRYAIDDYNAVQTTGIDRDELIRAGGEIRAYFNNNQETLQIRVEQNGRQVSLFNERETAHMADVKDRFRTMNRVQEFSILYGAVYVAVVVLWAREVSIRALAAQVAIGSFLVLAAVGIAGAIGMAGFDSAWEGFHRLIFSNDFWRLNPATDHLIQMFPPAFWESIVFFIGVMVAAEAALLLIGAGVYLGATQHQRRFQHAEAY